MASVATEKALVHRIDSSGNAYLRGNIWEDLQVENIDLDDLSPGPALRIKDASGDTLALINSQDFTITYGQGRTGAVQAGSIVLKGRAFIGGSPDRLSSQGPLKFLWFSINNGDENTSSETVTLNHVATNGPTHYMASESSSMAGAQWQAYSSAPSFTLSSGTGVKTVYMKVKNDHGESVVVADTITTTN